MKKALFAVAAVALLAVTAQAGEIKLHQWPCTLTPVEITSIPVVMDVGYWVSIQNQNNLKITLAQESIHVYSGCTNMTVKTNVAVTLSTKIAATGDVPGNYSSWIDGSANVPMGTSTVKVCAKVTNADLSGVPGGTTGKQVASVTIMVVPTT
jgi:uncharacterized lipoprotein YajG